MEFSANWLPGRANQIRVLTEVQACYLEGIRALAHTVHVEACIQADFDIVDLFVVLNRAVFV